MGELDTIGLKYKTDKSSASYGHGFLDVYEPYFAPLKDLSIRLLEIGIFKGASMKVWEEYFKNSNSMFWGIENHKEFKYNSDRTKTLIGKQQRGKFLKSVIDYTGGNFDIIIDDGSHFISEQQASFGFLFRHLKSGGIYIIEDLHSSFDNWRIYNQNKNITTYDMIVGIIKDQIVKSDIILNDDKKYIEDNVEKAEILCGKTKKSKTCIIIKGI